MFQVISSIIIEAVHAKHVLAFKNVRPKAVELKNAILKNLNLWCKLEKTVIIATGLVFACLLQVDVLDVTKTAEAFLKISSVYKEDDEEVKSAVLESIGEMT